MVNAIRRALAWSWRAFCYTLGIVFVVLLLYQSWFAAHIWYWAGHNPDDTSFIQARLERLRDKDPKASLKQQWAGYARISDDLKRAVIVAEDSRFYEHDGFDWEGIQKALEKNQRRGKVVAGGSTISQQLAKNLFLSGERSLWRKAQEAVARDGGCVRGRGAAELLLPPLLNLAGAQVRRRGRGRQPELPLHLALGGDGPKAARPGAEVDGSLFINGGGTAP